MKTKNLLTFSFIFAGLALILLVGLILVLRQEAGAKSDSIAGNAVLDQAGTPIELPPAETSTPTASLDLPLPTDTIMPEPTLELTATSALPTPTETQMFSYPESFYIKNITGHRQVYSLGCEASASVDWAGYFDVPIIEYTFQVGLPLSDNPDYGFVGDVNSPWGQIPPYGYGVHAEPVADLLISYGLPAKAVRNYSIDELKQQLSQSKPAIVWVIGNMEWSEPVNYTDSEGRISVVAPFEHVVIATGYDSDSIRYMSNGKFYDTPTEVFARSWSVLGNMAVIYDK
jgi:uncharacterized protein YvpB